MSTATKEDRVDEARDALESDIHELKSAGASVLTSGEAKLPWIIGAAAGLVIAGLGVKAMTPRRQLLVYQRPSFFGRVVRAAALAATGVLVRRYVQRVVDRAFPQPPAERVAPTSS